MLFTCDCPLTKSLQTVEIEYIDCTTLDDSYRTYLKCGMYCDLAAKVRCELYQKEECPGLVNAPIKI